MTEQKSALRKIAYNCKKATLLIEKKQIEPLTMLEKLELKIHLAGCGVCRIFERQSIMINAMVKQLIHNSRFNEVHLNDAEKKRMQHRIDEELNNSK